jgi:hypothetical protein
MGIPPMAIAIRLTEFDAAEMVAQTKKSGKTL